MFEGIITALITPFKNNEIDFDAYTKLIQRQIDAGIKTVLVAGSTGESSSLTEVEYYHLIENAVKIINGRINVIANVSGSATRDVCDKTRKVSKLGIDGIMVTLPHYIRPEQNGLVEHLKQAANSTILPVMLYLNPGRTACNISDVNVIELSKIKNIVAFKDSSDDLNKPTKLLPHIKNGFVFSSGNDDTILTYCVSGARGLTSPIANIMPKTMNKIYHFCANNDFLSAQKLMQEVLPIISACYTESNPIGIKYLAHSFGLVQNELRLPLTPASETTKKAIAKILNKAKELEENA